LNRYHLEVRVVPRPGLLDPQGKAIHHSLHSLGYTSVTDVRVGRAIMLDLDADSEAGARDRAEEMCRKLLANPVTEDFTISVLSSPAPESQG
jgi:phosphoribosylformylglycinamidine synthase PurS subunit